MKLTILALVVCCLCATAAFGQAVNVLSNEPQIVEPISHPQHAAPQNMLTEQSLLITSGYVAARGERPLWEFATLTPSVPLGDTARLLRQEHAAVKKSKKVWEN